MRKTDFNCKKKKKKKSQTKPSKKKPQMRVFVCTL